jgi:hypothetical protein
VASGLISTCHDKRREIPCTQASFSESGVLFKIVADARKNGVEDFNAKVCTVSLPLRIRLARFP